MAKKILSIVLSLCMILTMLSFVTVSASGEDIVAKVVTSTEGDGSYTITFASTVTNIGSFGVKVEYDNEKYTLESKAKNKVMNADLYADSALVNAPSANSVKIGWSASYGMQDVNDENVGTEEGAPLAPNTEGLYEIATIKFNLNKEKLADADYDNKLKITFTDYSFGVLDAEYNATKTIPTETSVEFNIPDTRTEIPGLSLEGKEVPYNGEVVECPVVDGAPDGADTEYTINGVKDAVIKDAGSYEIVATTKLAGYRPTVKTATVVVKKKTVTVTVDDATKVYGDANPDKYTAKVEGLVGTDELNYEVARAEGEDVGTYAITATIGENKNYEVTTNTPAEFTITKKPVTVTVVAAGKVYGEEDPELKANVEGLVGTDTLNYTVARAEGEDVDTYAITATVGENKNYEVTTNTPAEFKITKAAYNGDAVVVAKNVMINKVKSYEVDMISAISAIKEAKVEAAVKGSDASEIISSVTTEGNVVKFDIISYAEEVENIASIKVTVSSKNYENFDATIKLSTVDKEELTIEGVTVANKTYDAVAVAPDKSGLTVTGATEVPFDNETLVYTYEGIEGTVYSSTEAPVNAGTYNLVVSVPDENENYAGSLTVKFEIAKKEAKITIANAEKKVGDEDPTFTATVEGLVGEDTLSYTLKRAEGATADDYVISAELGENPNYEIDVVEGTLTISKYVLTVKAPVVVVYVGKEMPTLEATIEGAAEGDTITATIVVKNDVPEIVDPALIDTNIEAVYTTEVTCDADEAKYDVSYVPGTITVRKASGRPSGGGTVIKPATGGATGGSTGGSTTKPEDKEDENKDDETGKPAASASIALKEKAEEIKFIEGYEDKTFRPDSNATRNDVVSALTALFDITDVENAPSFGDTDDKAIKDLAAAGVINGYEDGTFKGHNDVTRAEFVKLVAAALKLETVEGATANFSDIEGHWAIEWIKTFVNKGYLVGYPDGTFRPEDKITRAEMVVVMTRVAGTVADADAIVNYADVDDAHWAYDYIMKAAK